VAASLLPQPTANNIAAIPAPTRNATLVLIARIFIETHTLLFIGFMGFYKSS
jgi:hypothetical protein